MKKLLLISLLFILPSCSNKARLKNECLDKLKDADYIANQYNDNELKRDLSQSNLCMNPSKINDDYWDVGRKVKTHSQNKCKYWMNKAISVLSKIEFLLLMSNIINKNDICLSDYYSINYEKARIFEMIYKRYAKKNKK